MKARGIYYNEHDPAAAGWLERLIAAGALPSGDVDRRDVQDVRPDDIKGYVQAHFFAGIGGWPLALRSVGWRDDRPVWTASVPCQGFSRAGLKRGF
jgi:DNA (cytosine-5)-methyltransferase 1